MSSQRERALNRAASQISSSLGWSVVDYGGGRLLSFAAVIYIARVIGAIGFGTYSIFVSAAQTGSVLVECGSASYGTREIAQRYPKHEETVWSITHFRMRMALIGAALVGLALALLPAFRRYEYIALATCGYLIAFSLALDWYYAGLRLFRPIAVANLCKGAAFLTGCLFLVRDSSSLHIAVAMYAAAPLVAVVVLALHSSRSLGLNPFRGVHLAHGLLVGRESVSFAGISLATTLYPAVPLYMLAWIGGMQQVGSFSAAQRPVLIAASSVLPIAAGFYPFICRSYADPDGFRASQALFQHVALILTVPVAIVVMTDGDCVMRLLYGTSYLQAFWPFRIMSLMIPLCALRLTFTHPLLGGHRQRVVAAIALGATAATAVLVYALFRSFGLSGAAWAVVSGEALFAGLSMTSARSLLGIPPLASGWRPIALSSCLMTVPLLLLHHGIVSMVVSIAIYAAAILASDEQAKHLGLALIDRMFRLAGSDTIA